MPSEVIFFFKVLIIHGAEFAKVDNIHIVKKPRDFVEQSADFISVEVALGIIASGRGDNKKFCSRLDFFIF